jgi:hypothetical protein
VKLSSQRLIQRNARAPDRVSPIRSSPVFGLFDGRIGAVSRSLATAQRDRCQLDQVHRLARSGPSCMTCILGPR